MKFSEAHTERRERDKKQISQPIILLHVHRRLHSFEILVVLLELNFTYQIILVNLNLELFVGPTCWATGHFAQKTFRTGLLAQVLDHSDNS